MAQTRRKRTRKHRGTPAGTIERSGRTGRPRTRAEAKQISRQRRADRFDKPPTWKGAIQRAAIAAVVFGAFAALLLKRSVGEAAVLVVPIFFLYIPLGFWTDNMMYRFRQRRRRTG
jgi:uncharacterized membrane protein YoaK (UPF0700 family)